MCSIIRPYSEKGCKCLQICAPNSGPLRYIMAFKLRLENLCGNIFVGHAGKSDNPSLHSSLNIKV